MIVKMKKVFLVTVENEVEKSLRNLRDAGLMHLNVNVTESAEAGELQEKKDLLEKAFYILNDTDQPEAAASGYDADAILQTAEKIVHLKEKITVLNEEIQHIDRDIQKLLPWGDFKQNDLNFLRDKNINIKLFELTADQFNKFPKDVMTFIINRTKSLVRIAAVLPRDADQEEFPFEQAALPGMSLSDLKRLKERKSADIRSFEEELDALNAIKPRISNTINEIEKSLEFVHAVGSMSKDGRIAYISGYIPERDSNKIKEIASQNHWGVMITDPSDNDAVPTLIENPKWIRAISPVFNLLGTIPGYKEFDISIWFLMFFSIFWAMIVGDAGYGLLFLVFTILGRIKFRKAPFEPFLLLFITSITTIAWGGITGNWFGAEVFAKSKIFSWMIIPSIASFSNEGGGDKIIMGICFILGAVHLTIAHLMGFLRLFPSLKAYSELGRLSLVWALFMLIRNLILRIELPSFFIWLLVAGLGLIIVFSEQNGKFFKGIMDSFKNLIAIVINSISFFSDIVSYVRLFAVGLASFAVAKSFNEMALSLGSGVLAVGGSVLILFFAHSLNIVLSMMSLIVHGVRLNMLEFSGHLNIEWSGFSFKPFKNGNNK